MPSEFNREIPPEFELIIMRLLEKDPDERYQSARDVKQALSSLTAEKERSVTVKPNHNIPDDISSFVGRTAEIEAVIDLFPNTRIITLTGVGGTGKSRIAYQIARRIVNDFEDGVRLVELAPISESQMVEKTIANALQIRERKDVKTIDTITEYLYQKEMLLLFDNCEHLIRDCGRSIASILSACPGIKVLVTSRESLGISGESTYIVPSMQIPIGAEQEDRSDPWQVESMQLFFERAKAVNPEFSPTDAETKAAVEVCQRLDGMPLAIELAAARVRIMPLEEIASRLSSSFRLLTGGSRTALPRQQTLRALIDWSYDLLTGSEKILFRRLAVFSSGWTITAAEEVCADGKLAKLDILDLLARLADKSIINTEGITGESRHRLLEPIRQYGLEKLIQSKEIQQQRAKHLAYFRDLVQAISPKLHGSEQGRWLDVLELDHENMRAALDWGVSGDGSLESLSTATAIANALLQFWMVRGYWMEAWNWVEKIRMNPEFPALGVLIRTNLLNTAGKIIYEMGDIRKADDLFHQALFLARESEYSKGEAYALLGLAEIALNEHFIERADQYIDRSFQLFFQEEKITGQAIALSIKGGVSAAKGDYEKAKEFFNRNILLHRETGDLLGIAGTLLALGNIEIMHGENEKGRAYFSESLEIYRRLRDKSGEAGAMGAIGRADLYKKDLKSSLAYHQEALKITRELHSYPGMGSALIALGEIARMEEDFASAKEYYLEAARINESLEQVGIVILVAHNLGYVEKKLGDFPQALIQFRRSLALAKERGHRRMINFCLLGIASVYIDMEEYDAGAGLLAAADKMFPDDKFDLDPVDQSVVDEGRSKLERVFSGQALMKIAQEAGALSADQIFALAEKD